MLDELTPDLILVAGGAAVLVLVVMLLVWLVSTRDPEPTSTQEVSALPNKVGGKKRKQYFSLKKKREFHREISSTDEEKDDDDEGEEPPRKSILKLPGEYLDGVSNNKGGNLHVEFKMEDTPQCEEKHSSLSSPPTSHPVTLRMQSPLSCNPDKDNTPFVSESVTTKEKPSHWLHKPDLAHKVTSLHSAGRHKKKSKPKQTAASSDTFSSDELPVSRISEILIASPLSDEDVEMLMGKLLEKQESNMEWEAANRSGGDSVKSLKRTNEELQKRCVEAEKAVRVHCERIKEFRVEIQREKSRYVTMESNLQAMLKRQNEEMNTLKVKVEYAQNELKELKVTNSLHQLDSVQENATRQLAIQNKVVHSLQEEISCLKTELHHAKELLKAANTDSHQLDRFQQQLAQTQRENDELALQIKNATQEHEKIIGDMLGKVKDEADQQRLQHEQEVRKLKEGYTHDKALQLSVSASEQAHLKTIVHQLEQDILDKEKVIGDMRVSMERLAEQAAEKSKLSADVVKAQEEKQEFEVVIKTMQEKLDDLKNKNDALRNKLWKARDDAAGDEKHYQELMKKAERDARQRVNAAREAVVAEQQQFQVEFLKRLFPSVEVHDAEDWLGSFEKRVSEQRKKKEMEMAKVRSREEKFSQDATSLRSTLLSTKEKLDMLQSKCVEREERLMGQLNEAVAAKCELERELERERIIHAQITEKLEDDETLQLKARIAEAEDQNAALKTANFDLNRQLESLSPVALTSSEV